MLSRLKETSRELNEATLQMKAAFPDWKVPIGNEKGIFRGMNAIRPNISGIVASSASRQGRDVSRSRRFPKKLYCHAERSEASISQEREMDSSVVRSQSGTGSFRMTVLLFWDGTGGWIIRNQVLQCLLDCHRPFHDRKKGGLVLARPPRNNRIIFPLLSRFTVLRSNWS